MEDQEEHLSKLVKWITSAPPDTTLRINTLHPDSNSILTQVQQLLEEEYRSRNLRPQVSLHPQLPDLAVISVPPTAPLVPHSSQVVVDAPCGEAVLRGAHVFAPGVLACPVYLQQGAPVSVYADITGLCRRGLTKTFDGPKLFVGNGRMVLSRAELFASNNPRGPTGLAVRMEATPLNCPPLHGLLPGLVFPQNLPSVVCSHVLGPQPGELVLDMCAAPGGKTAHIATLMEDQGVVVALDKTPGKVDRLTANIQSWGLTSVQTYVFNSCKAVDSTLTTPSSTAERHQLLQERQGPPYPPGLFDRILLDAPCSGLGQRPRLSLGSVRQLSSYPPLQKTLFSTAVQLLKPGGTLVYSTCSLARGENEGLVEWALDNHPCLQLASQEPQLGGPGWGGDSRLQRFPPTFSQDTSIGFFIAKFIKS